MVTAAAFQASARTDATGAWCARPPIRVVAGPASGHILSNGMATTLSHNSLEALAARLHPERLRRDMQLAPYTTFRIGGPADLLYDATSADDLANAILSARDLGVPYFLMGLGANILVGDQGVRGLVIRNIAARHNFFDDGRLWVESGAVVGRIIPEAVAHGWSGL